jgi:hypothetical protein
MAVIDERSKQVTPHRGRDGSQPLRAQHHDRVERADVRAADATSGQKERHDVAAVAPASMERSSVGTTAIE